MVDDLHRAVTRGPRDAVADALSTDDPRKTHPALSPPTWLLLLLPSVAFTPSVRDALRLHRTSDPTRMRLLWRRSLLLAGLGTLLLVAVPIVLDRVK